MIEYKTRTSTRSRKV